MRGIGQRARKHTLWVNLFAPISSIQDAPKHVLSTKCDVTQNSQTLVPQKKALSLPPPPPMLPHFQFFRSHGVPLIRLTSCALRIHACAPPLIASPALPSLHGLGHMPVTAPHNSVADLLVVSRGTEADLGRADCH